MNLRHVNVVQTSNYMISVAIMCLGYWEFTDILFYVVIGYISSKGHECITGLIFLV